LEDAHCTMAFIGLESLNQTSLHAVNKRHNRVAEYQEQFLKLKERGILTFTGMMLAIDGDTAEYYEAIPEKLERVDPSAIFLSISIPIPGTPFERTIRSEGRIIDDDLRHYDGDHLVFEPTTVTPDEVCTTFRELMTWFYSWPSIGRRWWRLARAFLGARRQTRVLFRLVVMTAIYLKLSLFQRDRVAQKIAKATDVGAIRRRE